MWLYEIKIPSLRKHTLKCWEIRGYHDVQNLPSEKELCMQRKAQRQSQGTNDTANMVKC